MLEHTKHQMAALRLYGMLDALNEQIQNPPHQLSFEERFAILIERESIQRENQRLNNRLKQAKLKSACLEHVDFDHKRALNKSQLLSLAQGAWVKQHRSIIVTGPTGTGKTFIACALAHKACLLGATSKYYRLLQLTHDITVAYREGKLSKFLALLNKIDVLIIDDFGMFVMDDEQKRLLLEILEHRYEIKSTIMTSQLPVEHWHAHIDDPIIADALLDRIIHLSEKIALDGPSMRKLNAQNKHKKSSEEVQ